MQSLVSEVLDGRSFRWLMEAASDAMLLVDFEGRILLANPAAQLMFGYSDKEFARLAIEELIPQRFRNHHQVGITRYSGHPESRKMGSVPDLFALRKDESEFAVDVSLSPIENSLVLATIHDITRRKQVEESLKAANQELRNFAHVISHDLKAPLRAISSLADWIATDQKDRLDVEGQEYLSLLIRRVQRMDALIDGVLQYSRVGRVHEAITLVDIEKTVREVIDSLEPPTSITISIENVLPTIRTERTCILQIFQNLIANSIRFMDKNPGRIRINCQENQDLWCFCVSDNGPGIETRHFERIFQLFQTLNSRDLVKRRGRLLHFRRAQAGW